MHAAVSYFYTHEVCLGSDQFSKTSNRKWTGNPTLSDIIIKYIRSLYCLIIAPVVLTCNLRVNTPSACLRV